MQSGQDVDDADYYIGNAQKGNIKRKGKAGKGKGRKNKGKGKKGAVGKGPIGGGEPATRDDDEDWGKWQSPNF